MMFLVGVSSGMSWLSLEEGEQHVRHSGVTQGPAPRAATAGPCGAVLRLPGLPPLTAPRAAEVHRHVHGPLHGRLERGFSRLQLPAAAGESQHVTRGRSAAAAAINRR